MSKPRAIEREAQRLVRCYPKGWRARYGDEFTQLLVDELTEGEVSVARKLDVFAHGAWTRLTYVGLAGSVLDSQRRTRSLLGELLVVSALFVMLAVGVWAQLTIGLAVVGAVERRNHGSDVVDVCWTVRFGRANDCRHCADRRVVAWAGTRGRRWSVAPRAGFCGCRRRSVSRVSSLRAPLARHWRACLVGKRSRAWLVGPTDLGRDIVAQLLLGPPGRVGFIPYR